MKWQAERKQQMEKKKVSPLFRIVKGLLKAFYPRISIVGLENLPDEPCVIAANHCQMHGPIACELYFPKKRFTWCAGEMMELKQVPEYAFRDFWSQKPRRSHWFYRILAHLIAPLSVLIFNNASTIGVYRDTRIMTTFRNTISAMCDGANVVIFPEYDQKFNHILYEFQDGFVDVARMYQRKAGKEVCFVPMYIAPKLKKMFIGKPLRFDAKNPINQERERVCAYLKTEITKMACACPPHTVIPYRNIPKKLYPKNIPNEV